MIWEPGYQRRLEFVFQFGTSHLEVLMDQGGGWPPKLTLDFAALSNRATPPLVLNRLAAGAWCQAGAGELADEELYCCDAQWCGLFDRMRTHTPQETDRRLALAAESGQ